MAENPEEESDPTGRYSKTSNVLSEQPQKFLFKAFDNETAVELLWIEYTNVPASCLQELAEGGIQRILSFEHPNLLRYHSAWVDVEAAKAVFIHELVTSDLRKFLSRRVHLNPSVFKNWCNQVLSGIQYLHHLSPPFVHRDLKASNVFIRSNSGQVKIGGLERSYFLHSSHPALYLHSDGSPGYTAPDDGPEPTAKADIYSFGMTLLEIFTLDYPYQELKTSFHIHCAQRDNVSPASLAKVENPDVREVIQQCILDMEARPTAGELAQLPFFSSGAERAPTSRIQTPGGSAITTATSPKPGELASFPPRPTPRTASISLKARAAGEINATPPAAPHGSLATLSLPQPSATNMVPGTSALGPAPTPARLSIKCFTEERPVVATCVRFYYSDHESVASITASLAADFGLQASACAFAYRDADGDYVKITAHTSMDELREHALSMFVFPSSSLPPSLLPATLISPAPTTPRGVGTRPSVLAALGGDHEGGDLEQESAKTPPLSPATATSLLAPPARSPPSAPSSLSSSASAAPAASSHPAASMRSLVSYGTPSPSPTPTPSPAPPTSASSLAALVVQTQHAQQHAQQQQQQTQEHAQQQQQQQEQQHAQQSPSPVAPQSAGSETSGSDASDERPTAAADE